MCRDSRSTREDGIRIRTLSILAVLATAAPLHSSGESGEREGPGSIAVTIVDVRPDQGGSLICALYRGDEHWLDTSGAYAVQTVPAESESLTLIFETLPKDSVYALQVIHDKNENGKFDMRKFPFPKPKEGAGVSNNNLRWGPPEYEKARFSVSAGVTRLRIVLSY